MDNKRINTILYSCGLTILCAILFMVFIILYRFNQRMDKLDELLAKSSTTLTMVNSSAQQIQSTAKSFKEQFDEPSVIQARKNMQLALTSAAQHTAFVTLPKFDESLDQVSKSTKSLDKLVSNTDNSLNNQVVPAVTQTILTTELEIKETGSKIRQVAEVISKQYLVDSHEVTEKLSNLLATGQISLENFDKKSEELTKNINSVLVNTSNVMDNVNQTVAEFPAMARHARRWQPLITGARLVVLLMGIFNP